MPRRVAASASKEPSPARPARGRRPQSRELRAARDALYREHIMAAAERIFAEQGFDDTKMQDIARAVGISLATLYQAYPGKQELYRAILIARDGEMLGTVMAQAQQVIEQPQTIERLLGLMETHLRFLLEHPDYLRMQIQQGHVWYHSSAWPSQEEQQMWERGLSTIAHFLAWGQGQGFFVPGDTMDQARLLMAMQQTRLANWVGAGMREAHDVVLARVQADFVRSFCRTAFASRLLTPDGAMLSAETQGRIQALN